MLFSPFTTRAMRPEERFRMGTLASRSEARKVLISASLTSGLPALRKALRSLPIILPLAPEASSSAVPVVLTDSTGTLASLSPEAVSTGADSRGVPSLTRFSAPPDASRRANWASTQSSGRALMRLGALSARPDFEGLGDFLVEVGLLIQAHFLAIRPACLGAGGILSWRRNYSKCRVTSGFLNAALIAASKSCRCFSSRASTEESGQGGF
jgi:hypothetical protein